MNTQSVSVHKAALNVQANSKSYGEGSSVYLRVLKDNGGGKFTVGFGGNRFLISSQLSLKEGEAFLARIKVDGQKVFLVREMEQGVQKPVGQAISALFDSKGNILEGALSSYFEKLGLAPDSFNYYLFQTLKSLSIPFSRNLFRKARLIASHFPGRELAAGKAFLALQQKGLEAGIEEVRFFLDGGDFEDSGNFEEGGNFKDGGGLGAGGKFEDGGGSEAGGNFKGHENSEGSGEFIGQENSDNIFFAEAGADREAALFKEFFTSLSSLDFIKKSGLLSLFNHSGFGKSLSANGSWIKIPVEYSVGVQEGGPWTSAQNISEIAAEENLPAKFDGKIKSLPAGPVTKPVAGPVTGQLTGPSAESVTRPSTEPVTAKGSVFLFLNPQEKKVKKISASVNFFEKNYKFVVLLNNNETRVILNEEFDLLSFKKNFPEWKVRAGSDEEFDFPSGEESLILVDGRV
ncbi:MAG: hypothetical protein K6E78_08375 [Treponema sp.]|nr:hypothetical protein [Treponema sp.]